MTKRLNLIILLIAILIFAGGFSTFWVIKKNTENLPDYEKLREYTPIITTRLYAADGALITEYSKEKRVFVPIENIPKHVANAFIAAEDASFYQNSGVDFFAIVRTAIKNTVNVATGRESMGGASTITQQVVKNFLLTRERTFQRKIKEAILAFKMTKAFPKDKILELYLNQIYLGSGAYGVAAAAEVYFDKSIDELTIEEDALLATLPKAPSRLDPRKNIEQAKYRRNWVINRMIEEGFITAQEGRQAKEKPIVLKNQKNESDVTRANFFADSVKKELTELYGSDNVFEEGIVVSTTLNSRLQKIANAAFTKGIEDYDQKHGYRGRLGKIDVSSNNIDEIAKKLQAFTINKLYKESWQKAAVLNVQKDSATIVVENTSSGNISLPSLSWARKYININRVGESVKKASDVLQVGDVILVEKTEDSNNYILRQIPEVNGGFLAIDPHSGRVLAMMGGYVDMPNQFNRTTQAYRQPGSTMKTFAYLAALENGMTPATIIMDEPISLNQGFGLPPYNPTNYSGEFYGPTTLRRGLELSQNVTTVRMANEIGIDKVVEVLKRLGVNDDPQKIYSLVLGSTETTLMRMVTAYSAMINGGYKITPSMIEKIQDRSGATIYRRDKRPCNGCVVKDGFEPSFPSLSEEKERLIDDATAYQITYMLQGVVDRGTAAKASSIGKIMGGKTGTTNNAYDSWFIGFSPDLIAAVYVGFDTPKSLGNNETGSSVALPIFIDFMKEALKDSPSTPFRVPNSVKFVKIDRTIGKFPTPETPKNHLFFEAFKVDEDVNKILSKSLMEKVFDDNDSSDVEEKIDDEPSGIY